MEKEKTTDWHRMTGELDFNMTNDFLFRALMQEKNSVLAALAASMMSWEETEVASAIVENPIELRQAFDSKEFILDVKVLLNSRVTVNLEMQVINLGNWPDRSLSYLCRSYDNLNRGDDYKEVKPVYQIGITDFSPIKGNDRFFSRYMFQETEDHHLYSEKIGLFVLNLEKTDRITEEDRRYNRDLWAKMFKAKTWEDLKMLAEKSEVIDEAVGQIYKITRDEILRQKMEAREEYYRIERTNQRLMEEKDKALEERDKALEEKDKALEEKDKEIADLRARLACYEGPSW